MESLSADSIGAVSQELRERFVCRRQGLDPRQPLSEETWQVLKEIRQVLGVLGSLEGRTDAPVEIAAVQDGILALGISDATVQTVLDVCRDKLGAVLDLSAERARAFDRNKGGEAIRTVFAKDTEGKQRLPGHEHLQGDQFLTELFSQQEHRLYTDAAHGRIAIDRSLIACYEREVEELFGHEYVPMVYFLFILLRGETQAFVAIMQSQCAAQRQRHCIAEGSEDHFFSHCARFLAVYGDVSAYVSTYSHGYGYGKESVPSHAQKAFLRMAQALTEILRHPDLRRNDVVSDTTETNLFSLLSSSFEPDEDDSDPSRVKTTPWFWGNLSASPFSEEHIRGLVTRDIRRTDLAHVLVELNTFDRNRAAESLEHLYCITERMVRLKQPVSKARRRQLSHAIGAVWRLCRDVPSDLMTDTVGLHPLLSRAHAFLTLFEEQNPIPPLRAAERERVMEPKREKKRQAHERLKQKLAEETDPKEREKLQKQVDATAPKEVDNSTPPKGSFPRHTSYLPLDVTLRLIDFQKVHQGSAKELFLQIVQQMKGIKKWEEDNGQGEGERADAGREKLVLFNSLKLVLHRTGDAWLDVPMSELGDANPRELLMQTCFHCFSDDVVTGAREAHPTILHPSLKGKTAMFPLIDREMLARSPEKYFNSAHVGIERRYWHRSARAAMELHESKGDFAWGMKFARRALARYFGTGDRYSFFFSNNATEAFRAYCKLLRPPFRPGDNIVMTNQEYDLLPAEFTQIAGKDCVRAVPLHHDTEKRMLTEDELFQRLCGQVMPKKTRMILISSDTRYGDSTCSVRGSKRSNASHLRDLVRRLKERFPYIPVVIDGCQSIGRTTAEHGCLEADVYLGSGGKALGVGGLGFVGIDEEHLMFIGGSQGPEPEDVALAILNNRTNAAYDEAIPCMEKSTSRGESMTDRDHEICQKTISAIMAEMVALDSQVPGAMEDNKQRRHRRSRLGAKFTKLRRWRECFGGKRNPEEGVSWETSTMQAHHIIALAMILNNRSRKQCDMRRMEGNCGEAGRWTVGFNEARYLQRLTGYFLRNMQSHGERVREELQKKGMLTSIPPNVFNPENFDCCVQRPFGNDPIDYTGIVTVRFPGFRAGGELGSRFHKGGHRFHPCLERNSAFRLSFSYDTEKGEIDRFSDDAMRLVCDMVCEKVFD